MKSSRIISNTLMEEQASLWAARLDGTVLSTEQRIALDHWLAADSRHRDLLSEYCQLSADLEQQLPLVAAVKETSTLAPEATVVTRPRAWWHRPAFGLTLATAAAVAVVAWIGHSLYLNQRATLATTVGQRHALTLRDGSTVELNSHTNLDIAFSSDARRVTLRDGEAFFAVAKNASRPFIVQTSAGEIRVTGTQFNVRVEPNLPMTVTVVEGSVSVQPTTPGHTPLSLTPNQHLSISEAEVVTRRLSSSELEAALAWRDGQIVFVEAPLKDALAAFSKFHGRKLQASPEVAELPVGGRFSLDDLDGFISSLEAIFAIKTTRYADGGMLITTR